MKPIRSGFGFWLLLLTAFIAALLGEGVESSIFTVGAVLFNAIKTGEEEGSEG